MARFSDSCYGDSPGRPQKGLSLSTGRFEGRPVAAPKNGSRANAHSSSTRHNPLRDEYPSSHERRYRSEIDYPPDKRRSFRFEDESRPEELPQRPRRSGRGNHARAHGAGTFGLRANSAGVGRLATGIVLAISAAAFAMAIFHVGPFEPEPVVKDGAKHLGVQSVNAAGRTASYLAQNAATRMSFVRPIEPDLALLPAYSPTREDLLGLSGQQAPFAFSLGSATDETGSRFSAPVLSDPSLVSLNNALSFYDNNGYDVGYLFMDLGTGRGIAGNLDATVYGASSFKGPFSAYIVSQEFPDDINQARQSRVNQVEDTIIWSDNESYDRLRTVYGDEGMEEWLADAGVDASLLDDTFYPHYTTRQSALMWLKIYQYLTETDTSAAQWLSDALGQTEVSFLRNGALGTTSAGHTDYLPEEEEVEAAEGEEAIEDAAEGEVLAEEAIENEKLTEEADKTVASIGTNITVRNKAGWIHDDEVNGVCDSGIVTIGDRDYLMTIMTNSPDSAASEQAFAHLARTLLEIRSDLV